MKDSKGHGSNTGTKGMRLLKTYTNGPHSAKVYKNPEWGEHVAKFFQNGTYQSKADYHTDDASDAHSTAQAQLARYGHSDPSQAISEGHPKTAQVETHPAHGYNAGAVNDAIASSNRAGRRIGGKEGRAIHALLKGRH